MNSAGISSSPARKRDEIRKVRVYRRSRVLTMNRRARFSELWKWISSYSKSIRLSSHGVRARSIPAVSTVDCKCIRCKMQKTISAVYRTNSGMSGREGNFRVWVWEFMEMYFSAQVLVCAAARIFACLQSGMHYRLSAKIAKITIDCIHRLKYLDWCYITIYFFSSSDYIPDFLFIVGAMSISGKVFYLSEILEEYKVFES